MSVRKRSWTVATLVLFAGGTAAQGPLPPWNDTAPKKALVALVVRVTKEGPSRTWHGPPRASLEDDARL